MGNNASGIPDTVSRIGKYSGNSTYYRKSPSITSYELATTFCSFGSEVLCVLDESLECLYLSENWQADPEPAR